MEASRQTARDAHIERILGHVACQALDHDLLDGAEFTIEKLLAISPGNADAKYLLGLVYYRQRRFKAAANVTGSVLNHRGCIYTYANSCLRLKMYPEGIAALEQTQHSWDPSGLSPASSDKPSTYGSLSLPDVATIYCVFGKLYQGSGDLQRALEAHGMAAKLNPYLWESIDALCKLGASPNTTNLYRTDYLDTLSSNLVTYGQPAQEVEDPFTAPASFAFKSSQQFAKTLASSAISGPSSSASALQTPGSNPDSFSTPSDQTRLGRSALQSHQHHTNTAAFPLAPQKRTSRSIGADLDGRKPPLLPIDVPRRSLRTPHGSVQRRGLNGKPTLSQPLGTLSEQPTSRSPTSAPAPKKRGIKTDKDASAKKDAYVYIVNLYRRLTAGYVALCKYQCRQAISHFQQLPEAQQATPWVLSKLGRANFEIVEYAEAERYYSRLRELDRCRTADMEYYSTLLWHLRKDVELSYLAHELIEVDHGSPQAWCSLGNSFSLKRETEQALKCFKRAVQLDPSSPYAYTLQAHEQVNNDAFETAQESFRHAINADGRHYNAWYGMGMVYMRLGNVEMAERHFKEAAKINPSNVVLICCIGMVLEKKGQYAEALEQYKLACDIQPNSALARYKKARALIHLKLYNAALVEFDHLKTLAPDEASVHFLLGQLYKVLHNRELAVKHFTIALNLDPKSSGVIRDALEGLSGDDD